VHRIVNLLPTLKNSVPSVVLSGSVVPNAELVISTSEFWIILAAKERIEHKDEDGIGRQEL